MASSGLGKYNLPLRIGKSRQLLARISTPIDPGQLFPRDPRHARQLVVGLGVALKDWNTGIRLGIATSCGFNRLVE